MSLELVEVGYRYAGAHRPALTQVSLSLEPGRVVGVVGANDAGKSTLCLVSSGLAPVTIGGTLSGRVTIDGLPTAGARAWELAERCGILFQNPETQLSGTSPTVWEEVAFGPRNLGLPLDEVIARTEASLELLGIGHLAAREPDRLSGGQAQLVALAAVLAMQPRYLILDEPTSQLDPQGTRLVGDALARLARERSTALLIVEHKTDLLARLADELLVLVDGAGIARGAAAELLGDPRLAAWGIEPPSEVRTRRAAERGGVRLERGAT